MYTIPPSSAATGIAVTGGITVDAMADDLTTQIEDYVEKNFPKGVSVPTGVSEDEAIQAVKKQFRDAGFDCPDETARGIVQHAWEQPSR